MHIICRESTNITKYLVTDTHLFHKSKYKKVGVLPIRIVKSNVSSVGPSLDFTIRIGSTPTAFLYFVSLLCLRSTLRLFPKVRLIKRGNRQCLTLLSTFVRHAHGRYTNKCLDNNSSIPDSKEYYIESKLKTRLW